MTPRPPALPLSPTALGDLDRAGFLEIFGGVFENAPWVAEAAWELAPFAGLEQLHAALVGVMRAATRERQSALIRGHPDLAGKAAIAGAVTAESREEQASAGLDQCAPAEFAELQACNRAYRDKFGFPFIMAVKGRNRHDILAAFAARQGNTPEAEFHRALDEIARIARLRLADLVRD